MWWVISRPFLGGRWGLTSRIFFTNTLVENLDYTLYMQALRCSSWTAFRMKTEAARGFFSRDFGKRKWKSRAPPEDERPFAPWKAVRSTMDSATMVKGCESHDGGVPLQASQRRWHVLNMVLNIILGCMCQMVLPHTGCDLFGRSCPTNSRTALYIILYKRGKSKKFATAQVRCLFLLKPFHTLAWSKTDTWGRPQRSWWPWTRSRLVGYRSSQLLIGVQGDSRWPLSHQLKLKPQIDSSSTNSIHPVQKVYVFTA